MPQDRFFIDQILEMNQQVALNDEESHHLRVMRKRVGDVVELINGQNFMAQAEIISFDKKHFQLFINHLYSLPIPLPLILAQALPRLNRLDEIIEKGTEIGATEFWLFPGERSEKKQLQAKDIDRLRRVAISAMKQCGRYDLPKIIMKPPILQFKELPEGTYFGDISEGAPLFCEVWANGRETIFFIGPESGFSNEERLHLKKLQAMGVRLAPFTLRTETAPLVALSIIQYLKAQA